MASWTTICWLILYLSGLTESARILGIFAGGYQSHLNYNDGIMKSLHSAGHQITMITPFPPDNTLENYTMIQVMSQPFVYVGQSTLQEMASLNLYEVVQWTIMNDVQGCEAFMKSEVIQAALHSKEKLYDIMFVDMLFMTSCFLPLGEKLEIPIIGTVGLRTLKIVDSYIGMLNNPSTVPSELNYVKSLKMTFMERLYNSWCYLVLEYFEYWVIRDRLNQFYQLHFPHYVHNRKKLSLMFYNNHYTYLAKPNIPAAIEIAGVHVRPAKPVPKDMENFIEGAKHGVIIFTFGSIPKGSSMPAGLKNAFVKVFARIPQRILWKYEEPIEGLSDNVMLSKWLPQRDILEYKNVIAFISHCGQSGVYEAIHTATPIVAVPYNFDQQTNAAILENFGVAITLDIYKATTEDVSNALNSIINDSKYRENMQRLSHRFKDRPMSPQESVVYWTEYVLNHDGAFHLRTVDADMALYQYLLLDIIAFVVVVISIVVFCLFFILKNLCSLFGNYSKGRIHKTKKRN